MMKRIGMAAVTAWCLGSALYAQEERPVLCTMRGTPITHPTAAFSAKMGKRTVLFCCGGCKTAFEKLDTAGKIRAVKVSDLRIEKAVLQKKLERVDAELAALAEGTGATRGATRLTCAVTGEEIASEAASGGKSIFAGKTYFFCCAACKTRFDADPSRFVGKAGSQK